MADQDALAALGSRSENLLAMLARNKDLANVFMGVLWVIANTAAERGAKMDGIQIEPVTMTENRIRFQVKFYAISLASRRNISVQATSLADHIGRENAELWVFIRANPDIAVMLQQVLEKLDAYARDKGVPFADIKFSNGIMDDQDHFVLTILRDR